MTSLRGVLVAIPALFRDDLTLDLQRYANHITWLAEQGCHGVCPNGSLGEYIALSDDERAALVRTAVEAAPPGFRVVPGVGSPSGHASRRWAEQAAEAGADGILALPPNSYPADEREVLAHFTEIATVGLPMIVYNNPIDTKVDLKAGTLREIARLDNVVGVKEFSCDVRRVNEIMARAAGLDVYAGADDVLLESLLMGAVGWIGGFPSVFPAESVRLFELGLAGNVAEALPLYRAMLPLYRWDSLPQFVQAVKVGMDMVGRGGGPVRLPRLPLPVALDATVRNDVEKAQKNLAKLGVAGQT